MLFHIDIIKLNTTLENHKKRNKWKIQN